MEAVPSPVIAPVQDRIVTKEIPIFKETLAISKTWDTLGRVRFTIPGSARTMLRLTAHG